VTAENISVIIENPIKNIKDHKAYQFPDPYASHRFTHLEQAVQRFGETRAVILNVRDVFSDIRDLLGYENALIALITEQEYYGQLLDRVIEYNRTLAHIVRERFPINIIATTDDIAGTQGLIFSPKVFFNFLGSKFREVIQGFKHLGYYCIKHCDGDIMPILDYWIDCGIDCIDPIDPLAGMDLSLIKQKYGHRICIKGNVDCTQALVSGTEQDVEQDVKACIQQAAYGGGYILSSSNMIHSGVQAKNYVAMIKALRQYGQYPIASSLLS
jgi:uroporphyrinogen decarboxylase